MEKSSRRTVLRVGGLTATGILAGCLRLDTQETGSSTGEGTAGGTDETDEPTDGTGNETDGTGNETDGTGNETDGISSGFWENADESERLVDEADETLQQAVGAGEEQLWDLCAEEVEGAISLLNDADTHAEEAMAVAEEEGTEQHRDAITGRMEVIDEMATLAEEIETMCGAGQEGDIQTFEQRRERVAQLRADLDDLRASVAEEFDALER